jgi:hypothetical protein
MRNAEMTKAGLIEALAQLPDDAEVFIEAWPDLSRLPLNGELYAIRQADSIPVEGDNPAFLTLTPDMEFKQTPARSNDPLAEV